MDVKSSFLNVYIEQPIGYVVKGQEKKTLQFTKSLYSLKQAPRPWNNLIDKYSREKDSLNAHMNMHYIVRCIKNGGILIVCLYVSDLIFIRNNPSKFEDFKKAMIKEFEMTNIWLMAYYLGIGMKQMEDEIFISQEGYAKEMLGTCWFLKGMGRKCLKMDVDCR